MMKKQRVLYVDDPLSFQVTEEHVEMTAEEKEASRKQLEQLLKNSKKD